ncbi:hypothetical protein OG264_22495 [Streptomyces xanthophaeus]|uniref:hypothetical protein n=1 Tax=Streptomyces xanthophaeus TaxID=67385 RepID=UPI003865C56C|nr:hypothetical protein OG264_22495 [Streptomyces xanthophaeus]WST61008.1 hypothetical protein OG605_15950 [Streptomyces xanthophaeus]
MTATGTPQLRLGYGRAEVALSAVPGHEDHWRLTADWYGELSADFEVEGIEPGEVIAFTDRLIAGMDGDEAFTTRLTPGRNNPLTVRALPVEDAFAFLAQLTPNGDDAVVHLDLDLDHVAADELRTEFQAFRRSLA